MKYQSFGSLYSAMRSISRFQLPFRIGAFHKILFIKYTMCHSKYRLGTYIYSYIDLIPTPLIGCRRQIPELFKKYFILPLQFKCLSSESFNWFGGGFLVMEHSFYSVRKTTLALVRCISTAQSLM